MNRMPRAAAGGERAARPWSRRPPSARPPRRGRAAPPSGRGVEAAELVLAQADHDLAVENADVAGTEPAVAHGALGGEPDLDPLAGREAVRDERRLECDDARVPSRARRRHLLGDPDHGIPPSRRAAARRSLEPELDPADEIARRERVAGAGRVEQLGREGRVVHAVHVNAGRAALDHPPGRSGPNTSRSRSVANTVSGPAERDALPEGVVDQRPRREVDRDARRPTHVRARPPAAPPSAVGSRRSA